MQKKGESQRTLDRLPALSRPFDVVGLGENSVDVLATVPHWPAPDEKLELLSLLTSPGGQTASALVGAARLGLKTGYLGVFGDDEHGRRVANALQAEGVDISECLTVRASTRSALIVVNPAAGTRAVMWRRDPDLRWPASFEFGPVIRQARALLLDSTDLEASVAAAEAAAVLDVPVLLDIDRAEPGIDRLLKHVDVLIAAQGFPESHTGTSSLGQAMRQLRDEYGSKAVVVTLGAGGAVAWDGAQEIRSAGFVVPVVDPTGAGDAFRAGFLAAWLDRSRSVPCALLNLLDFANATAALSCRATGAQAGLPSKAEVIGLLTHGGGLRSNQSSPATEVGHP